MLRIFRQLHKLQRLKRRVRFIGTLRMGLRLIVRSFKTVIFNHKSYGIFCVLILCIQLLRLAIMGLIDKSFSTSFLVTQSLMDASTFEVLFEQLISVSAIESLTIMLAKLPFLLIELIATNIVIIATVFFTQAQLTKTWLTVKTSLYKALTKQTTIVRWSLFQALIVTSISSLGVLGLVFEFAWQLSTSFALIILAFHHVSFIQLLHNTFKLLWYNLPNLLSMDIVIESILLSLSIFFYVLYDPGQVGSLITTLPVSYLGTVSVILFLYMSIVVMITEYIFLTTLYFISAKET